MPTRLVKSAIITALLVLSSPPSASWAAAPYMHYYGGRVLSRVQVVHVYWGTGVDSTVTNNIGPFYSAIVQSAYIDWLREYDTVGLNGFVDGNPGSNQRIRRGTYAGDFTIFPSNTNNTVTSAQIATELAAQITAGNLPAPTLDAGGNVNTVYMIDFPSGKTITRGSSTSCVQFCAIHDTMTFNGHSVPYGIVPYNGPGSACNGGCGSGIYLQNLTLLHSHELIDAITDTEVGLATTFNRPLAWYSQQTVPGKFPGEAGVICNDVTGTLTIGATTYTLQKGWSEALQQCIVNNPNVVTTTTIPTTTTTNTTITLPPPPPTTTTTTTTSTTSTTLGNPPFGGDDTGKLPPAKSDLLKCENKIAKAITKLTGALVKCHISRASGKITDEAGEEACEATAVAKFTGKAKTDGCGQCTDVAAIANSVEASVDASNGLAYCQ